MELVRISVEPSVTSGLVGGTANCKLGLGIACKVFSPVDMAFDKSMSTTELVVSGIELDVSVG